MGIGNSAATLRRLFRRAAFVAMLCVAIAPATVAAVSKVDRGELPTLKPDEGLLIVSIDSGSDLSRATFKREDSNWSRESLHTIKKGRTTRLFRLPAGRYRWVRTVESVGGYFWTSIDLSSEPEFTFEVKPGHVNYAGDLVYRSTGFLTADVRLSNRALPMLDWIETEHPQLLARYAFTYTGYYPDPFPGFYAKVRAGMGTATSGLPSVQSVAAPAPSGVLPLPPRQLWAPGSIEDVTISPDGQLIATTLRSGEKKRAIHLFDVESAQVQRVLTSDLPLTDIRWESERTLLVTSQGLLGSWLIALHVGEPDAAGARPVSRVDGPVNGSLVDLLPTEPGVVLYQWEERGQLVVRRLDLTSKAAVRRSVKTSFKNRLNVGVKDDLKWFADGNGRLRVAFARKGEEELVLMHGSDGVFREVMPYDPEKFSPLALSFDGEKLYALTDDGRAQRELVEIDLAQGRIGRTLYSRPGVDLVSGVFDQRRVPIGAMYYADGRLATHYFDDANRRLEESLRKAMPDRAISPVQRSRDGRRVVLWVDGSDQPAQLYLFHTAERKAELFGDLRPDLKDRRFVPTQVLKVSGSDGLPVQAFLTLPAGTAKRPLVVMPHGGPIGVSDDLHFNPEVQFLASLGYAVLQVNFRGSEGYGRAFREAGHRNFGKLIEEDIDAAIRAALAAHPLDESRMCLLGTSYGGYSAMVSSIRWPGRFRCAISIAGVSDRALFFTASDSGRDADTRKQMEKIMGNPSVPEDLADIQATSPLYRYRELTVPLMLVHGMEDARVDYEHSRRLVRLLGVDGRPPVLLTFEEEGHGIDELDNKEKAWTAIAGFLGKHLGAQGAVAASASQPATVASP